MSAKNVAKPAAQNTKVNFVVSLRIYQSKVIAPQEQVQLTAAMPLLQRLADA